MKKTILLVFVVIGAMLSSCQQNEAPKVDDVEGNINITASSNQKADLGNRVWRDDNADGIKQAGEKGFAGITVNLYFDLNGDGTADGDKIASQVTNERGYYRFKNLDPEPDYIIEVLKPSGYIFSEMNNEDARGRDWDSDIEPATGFSDTIDLRRGRYTYWIDAALRPEQIVDDSPADLGDIVWFDENHDGVRQVTEKGMADVKVSLYTDTSNDGKPDKRLETTFTDDEGWYQFEDLDPTRVYFVTLVLADYRGFSQLHNPAATQLSSIPASDLDNDFDPETGFAGPITLVPGEDNKWAADAGIREYHHSYQVQIYGNGRVDSADGKISCNQYGGKCYAQAPWGSDIELKASADNGEKFSNWVMHYLISDYLIDEPRNPVFKYSLNSHRIFTAKFVDKHKLVWGARKFGIAKWSPDGSKIAASDSVHTVGNVAVFNAISGQLLYTLDAKSDNFDWSPDSQKLAVTYQDSTTSKRNVAIIDASNGQQISFFAGEGNFGPLSWSPDGRKIAVVDFYRHPRAHRPKAKLKIYDAVSGTELSYLENLPSRIRGPHVLSWSPNSRYLASLSGRYGGRSDINIWKIGANGTGVKEFSSYDYFAGDPVRFSGRMLAWTRNSRNLISFYEEGDEKWLARIRVNDFEVYTYKEVEDIPLYAAISPNFKYIAYGKRDNLDLIKIFRLSNMKHVSTFAEHSFSVRSISWAKNSRFIVSTANDEDMFVWKIRR